MRSRAVPSGTVGGRIAGTQRPRSRRPSITARASSLGPITSAWMAVVESPSFHGDARNTPARPCAQPRDEAVQVIAPPLFGFDQREAGAQGAGQQRRRGRGEDVAAGFLQQPFDQRVITGDKCAGHAGRLAQGGHVEHAARGIRPREAEMRESAAALRPQHPEAVRIVQQQQRVVALAQGQQPGNVGDVAVHAEHRVADHQLAPRRTLRQRGGQRGQVTVRIAVDARARQPGAVDQARMVERVGEQRVAFADQRRDDADVGGVAGVEVQRARQLGEAGQFLFERLVRRAVAADQGRSARADAELVGTGAGGRYELRDGRPGPGNRCCKTPAWTGRRLASGPRLRARPRGACGAGGLRSSSAMRAGNSSIQEGVVVMLRAGGWRWRAGRAHPGGRCRPAAARRGGAAARRCCRPALASPDQCGWRPSRPSVRPRPWMASAVSAA